MFMTLACLFEYHVRKYNDTSFMSQLVKKTVQNKKKIENMISGELF